MAKKKEQEFTGADLKFRHFDLAKRLSVNMLQEMIQARLPKEEIPQVLNDMCKFVVLSEANVSKENALFVVQRFVELTTDLTCLMMRIVQNQTMEDFK